MPLRSKPGQNTITCIVGGDDPAAIARGRQRARDVARYYAGAAKTPAPSTVSEPTLSFVDGVERVGEASGRARDYFGHGAAVGAGGRWCVSLRQGVVELPAETCDRFDALGVLPQVQAWTEAGLEGLLLGAGRRGHGWAVDPATGTRQPAVRTHAWTFDLPKSLSLLSVYGQDDWLLETTEVAARIAMDILVSTSLLVRRREGPRIVHERALGLHYSLVLERTARGAVVDRVPGIAEISGLPAPHYHAHLLLHFAVNGQGQLCAPDVDDALQEGWRRLASAIADARVVAEARRRGIPLRARAPEQPGASWSWEVATIPDAAVDAASERHRVIVAARAGSASGPTGDLAAERLTKAAKDHDTDPAALVEHWRSVIESRGARNPFGGPDGSPAGDDRPGSPPGGDGAGEWFHETPEEEALKATFATASTARWPWVVADLLLRGAALREGGELWRWVTTVPRALERSGVLVPLRDGSLTTRAILDEENRILSNWRALADGGAASDRRRFLEPAVAAHRRATGQELDEGQTKLVERALGSGATIGVGVAGTGKTAALAVLRDAMARGGHRVHVVALAALRARESGQVAEASSDQSVASVLRAISMGTFPERFARGDALLVDEAAQLDDAALDAIVGACAQHGVRLVLLGDPKQQGPILRGGMFGELVRRAAVEQRPELVELTVAHRFRDPAMASALASYRAGDGVPLVSYLQRRGSIVETQGADDSLRRIVDAWWEDRSRLIITCGSNVRRDEIGAACAARLLAVGAVSPQAVAVCADVGDARRVALHVGEQVRIQRQIRDGETGPVIARNGEVAVLAGVIGTGADPRLRLRFEDREIAVEPSSLVATHACVLQSYKAQGATTESALVDWEDGVDLQRAYPALSRQRSGLAVFIAPQERAFDDLPPQTAAQRIAAAALRDNTPQAAISIGETSESSPDLRALTSVPTLTPPPATVDDTQASIDEMRVALAATGRLDARTLTLGELTVALREAEELARRRLLEAELIGVRRWDAGRGDASPPRPVPAWVQRLAEPRRPSPLRITAVRGAREPGTGPVWRPSPLQRGLLLRAERAWPEEERLATRVAVSALRRGLGVQPAAFRADLEHRWRQLALDHGVSNAPRPQARAAAQLLERRLEGQTGDDDGVQVQRGTANSTAAAPADASATIAAELTGAGVVPDDEPPSVAELQRQFEQQRLPIAEPKYLGPRPSVPPPRPRRGPGFGVGR